MQRRGWIKQIEETNATLSDNEFEASWEIFSMVMLYNLDYCQRLMDRLTAKGKTRDMLEAYDSVFEAVAKLADTLKEYEEIY